MNWKKIGQWLLLLALLIFTIMVAHRKGNDINVYLHAADSLWNGMDPYSSNPYNKYLYGPFFALLIKPLTTLGYPIARVIWALLCMGALYRSWVILRDEVLSSISLTHQEVNIIGWILLLLSVNVYIHNLNLGQVTLPMLWVVIEGMHQMRKERWLLGGAILAFGINLKILPLLVLFYYFLNWNWRPIFYSVGFLLLLLLIPALFVGWENNLQLHLTWLEVINPVGKRFGAEINDGCVSINCLMSRISTDESMIKWSTLILRLGTIGLMLWYFLRQRKEKPSALSYWKDLSILLLVILLIFPHQMKYSMLFILPAGAFLLSRFYLERRQWSPSYMLATICLVLPAIMGRDIIGNAATDLLDTIGILGVINGILLILLIFDKKKNPTSSIS